MGGGAGDTNGPICVFTPKAWRAQGRWVHPPAPDTVFDLGEADCSLVRNSKGEGRMLVLSFGTYAPATWRSRPWGASPFVQVFASPTEGEQPLAQATVSTGDGKTPTLTGTYTASKDLRSGRFVAVEGSWSLDLTVQCAESDVLDAKLLPPLPSRAPAGSALVSLAVLDWTWLLSGIRCEDTGGSLTITRDDRSCDLLGLRLVSNPSQRILGKVTLPDFFNFTSDWFLKGFRRLDQSSPANGTLEVEAEAPLRGFVSFPRGLGPDRVDFQCP